MKTLSAIFFFKKLGIKIIHWCCWFMSKDSFHSPFGEIFMRFIKFFSFNPSSIDHLNDRNEFSKKDTHTHTRMLYNNLSLVLFQFYRISVQFLFRFWSVFLKKGLSNRTHIVMLWFRLISNLKTLSILSPNITKF